MTRFFAPLLAISSLAFACPAAYANTLSTLGTPGLIDMPTAEVLDDGHVALTTNRFGDISRNTMTFQVLPRVFGVFRYSINRGYFGTREIGNPDLFDRSFDLNYQIFDETEDRPAVAFGLRDFGGTGILSSEYIVATKHFGERFIATGGIGWGRMAQRGAFDNPLAILSDHFADRPNASSGGIAATGQLDFGSWFRGDAAFFGGIEYQATDRLSFQLEYSSDAHENEVGRGIIDIDSPFNVGLNYAYPNGGALRAFVIGGATVGLQYSYTFDPAERRSPGGLEEAPLPIPPRNDAVLASWGLDDPTTQGRAEELLKSLLNNEGIALEGFSTAGSTAIVRIQNRRFDVEAQAIGRTARVMANVLPASISTFEIIVQPFGIPNSLVTLRRTDLETLQTDYDGAWLSQARSQIVDAPTNIGRGDELDGAFPKFSYGLTSYTALSFFDPDQPVRFDAGPQLTIGYQPSPGLSFDGVFRYPLYSSIDDATRQSNSVIQRVRSDAALYAIESDFEINRLTAEYMFRPAPNYFGRVTAGYLEDMYAGVSGEILWYPVDSNLALGAELNYVVQRDFDMLFGLQDYDVVTGHASAYYDFGNGFVGQVDAGRYLAGDWGATFGVDREFNNGFKIGAYFTLTDVSFDDFGEGSFDKGIRFSVPNSWFTGEPSRETVTRTIKPVQRDGGARLNVANRLYGVTRDYRADSLSDGWGRVFR
ncbi:YjbH domain-containing protein [Thalassobium sp. R2A62]|uniref:YjbH domain-containing protein n=1 Tax=Thalassobium sp. R2A62 TaxID=633131 RepID=UPI0001B1D81B|nr:YjbH domain-containing protein [Thalassobium sp. R2A62]EET49755.1 rb142 [Thalassobium sp. R2A62]